MWRVIGCRAVLVVGLLVAGSVIAAGVLAVGSVLGRALGVSTWEAAVLIVLVAGGLLWLARAVLGPLWLPELGLGEADEDAAPARSEGPPSVGPPHARRRRR